MPRAPSLPSDPLTGSYLGWLWRHYLRRRAGLIAAIFIVMAIEGSTLGLLSYMLEPLFDRVFAAGGAASLWPVGLLIFALFVVRAVTSLVSRTLLASVSQRVAADMQRDFLRHILRLDLGFFQDNAPGSLIERVVGDSRVVQGIWIAVIAGIGRDLVSLVGLFAVAITIDPWWTLYTVLGVPLLLVPSMILRKYLLRKAKQLREQAGEQATRLDEIFHGIRSVKLNRIEDVQESRFAAILRRVVRVEVKSAAAAGVLPALVDVITGLGFLAVLLLGGAEVADGTRTTGEFMAFFSAMVLTFTPIRRLSDLAGLWQKAAASLERMLAVYALRPAHNRPESSRAQPATLPPALAFDGVRFGYGDAQVLRGLSFTAEAGKVTAIVGPSGAGKSTVFHLLTGLGEPEAGRVLIGGVDVREMSLSDQRGLFATVSQDSALFDESLRDNLTLGLAGATEDDLTRALSVAQAIDFTKSLPQGLESPAGPRGSNLSGGQRQRIAIARALLRDAPVLLLDEATSALDTASEAEFARAMEAAGKGRTVMVIAHRLSTIRNADSILVLDQGRLAEQGTHAELLAKGGLYAKLHALQYASEGQG